MDKKKERILCQKLWAKNKYLVLSKSNQIYLEIRQYLKQEDVNTRVVERYIEQAVQLPEDKGQVTNAFHHVWGYFKKNATSEEKDKFFEKLEEYGVGKTTQNEILKEIRVLLGKYPNKYLQESTFIIGEN